MAVIQEAVATTDDGARIAYEYRNEPGASPPLLALHGVLVGTSNWVHQMLRLPQYRWIAPFFRGHGSSSPAGDHPEIEQAADDAVAVLDREGVEQAIVLGNSLGGTIGLALALLRPERVRALLLVEPSAPALLPDHGGDRLNIQAREAREAIAKADIDGALDSFLRSRLGDDWRRKIGGRRLEEWSHNVLSAPAWTEAVERFDPGPGLLAAIDMPILLVSGANTLPVYRELTEAVADAVPSAKLVIVPRAGHGVPADNPEMFNELLTAFLQDIGAVPK